MLPRILLALCVLLGIAVTAVGAAADPAFDRGDYVTAAEQWTEALRRARSENDVSDEIAALGRRAEAYLALGFLDLAEVDLTRALALVEPAVEPQLASRLKGMRGAVRTRIGDINEARADLGESLLLAVLNGDRRLEAVTLNNIGNFLLLERRHAEAIRVYDESAEIAEAIGATDLAWIAWLNGAEVSLDRGDADAAAQNADRAEPHLLADAATAQEVNGLIKLGRIRLRLAIEHDELAVAQASGIYRALTAARDEAAGLGNARLESFAAGYLGEAYEKAGRLSEAEALTRIAIARAQRANAPESIYLWQWQRGRILRSHRRIAEAIAAHRAAIETLGDVRRDIVAGFGSGRNIFEESVRPLILGLADLLLQESADATDGFDRQRLLASARETVELLKAAEFEDYFHDNCLAALQARRRTIDDLPRGTAALYPVVLPDRVELIVSVGGRLARFQARVAAERLEETVHSFRRGLADPGSTRYQEPAEQLYRWLIAPVKKSLDNHAVETLVVIPSGLLASIPFAALQHGGRFVIEERAVAVAPGLSLIDPRTVPEDGIQALLGGLTEPVQGYPALPFVAEELAAVNRQFSSTVLKNERLRRDDLEAALDRAPYRILHLATHAKFEAEASESFLLTYDGHLDMAGLEKLVRRSRFRDQPIELLTLSACATAAGDPRAALGLAGIALKSGARSALASLWVVNDRSTARLISQFYQALAAPGASKAQALRVAQLALLSDPVTRHPSYWAPFVVIGNWL